VLINHCTFINTCHQHPLRAWQGVDSGSFTAPDHPLPSTLELKLTATDSDNNVTSVSRELNPRTVNLNFATNPAGLAVLYGEQAASTPYPAEAIVNSVATLSAPSPQTFGNSSYVFQGWSDGQAQTHSLVTPSTNGVYTARFSAVRPGTQTLQLRAEGDSYVSEATPAANFGTTSPLRAGAGAGTATESHLRFLVDGVVGKIQSATLRLRALTDTTDGPAVYKTTAPWTETGVNWSNRPPASGGALSDAGAIAAGATVDYDVTQAVTGAGPVSFRLAGTSTDAVDFESREATTLANRPLLFVTVLNDAYSRPKGATLASLPLVPAYNDCTSPNRAHSPPLVSSSCAPPIQSSSELTIGTADANGAATTSTGSFNYRTITGDASTPADEADVTVFFSITDVRRKVGLADYAGELQARATARMTDKGSGAAGTDPATTLDLVLPVPIQCTPTAATGTGSTCETTTTMDALTPGMVREGARSIWQLAGAEVLDGGPDGDVDTPGNSVFMRQGLFVP
jgi:hypothetical protein